MAGLSPPFSSHNTEFAYQLRYHLGCQSRRRRPVFNSEFRQQSLIGFLQQVCKRGKYHLLESETDNHWLRFLISLKPSHAISKTVQTIKANTSRLMLEHLPEIEREIGRRALWSRGFYVRSVGAGGRRVCYVSRSPQSTPTQRSAPKRSIMIPSRKLD